MFGTNVNLGCIYGLQTLSLHPADWSWAASNEKEAVAGLTRLHHSLFVLTEKWDHKHVTWYDKRSYSLIHYLKCCEDAGAPLVAANVAQSR